MLISCDSEEERKHVLSNNCPDALMNIPDFVCRRGHINTNICEQCFEKHHIYIIVPEQESED